MAQRTISTLSYPRAVACCRLQRRRSAPRLPREAARRVKLGPCAERCLLGMNPRTRLLLEGPITTPLLKPRGAQYAHDDRAGLDRPRRDLFGMLRTHALGGVALVFPVSMLVQMMPAGARDGGNLVCDFALLAPVARSRPPRSCLVHSRLFGVLFTLAVMGGRRLLYAAPDQLSTSVVVISWLPCERPVISLGFRFARAAYRFRGASSVHRYAHSCGVMCQVCMKRQVRLLSVPTIPSQIVSRFSLGLSVFEPCDVLERRRFRCNSGRRLDCVADGDAR